MRLSTILLLLVLFGSAPLAAQSLMPGIDLESPDMTEATMTRDEVALELTRAEPDLFGARLNGLDLSGFDFHGANLRTARLNDADLREANFDTAILDQAWFLGAQMDGASLRGARLFQAQLGGASLRGADFTDAIASANFTKADLTGALFVRADLGADLVNQSMGLMRGVLSGAVAKGADFTDARLVRTVLDFADLTDSNFTNADLSTSSLAGANMTGARLTGADLSGADVTSAKLRNLVATDPATLAPALNLNRASRD